MSYRQVTELQRYFICALLYTGYSKTDIARILDRDRSTIQREIKRNSDKNGRYNPLIANDMAVFRRRNSRRVTFFTEAEWALVLSKIKLEWAPEQIAGRLAEEGQLNIHHATIYRHFKEQKRRGRALRQHFRQGQKQRRKGYGKADSRGVLSGKRKIEARPEAATDRLEYGHFEVDLIRGYQGQGFVMTLADRLTRFTRVVKLANKTAAEVADKLIPIAQAMRIKTFTADNGCEFHDYKQVEEATGVEFYFANPHCSWERGTIENMNGLIRQYLPKKRPLIRVTQSECDFIERRLNQRPRKMFNFKTPEEQYHEVAV